MLVHVEETRTRAEKLELLQTGKELFNHLKKKNLVIANVFY